PEITSATYDPVTDKTTIAGQVRVKTTDYYNDFSVSVFANDEPDESGYGEGQYFLGSVDTSDPKGREDEVSFRFVWPGRTPGLWIAATATAHSFFQGLPDKRQPDDVLGCADCSSQTTTSEFGRTVPVK